MLEVDDDGEYGQQVECQRDGCGALGPGGSNYDRQDNIAAWNTRWYPGDPVDQPLKNLLPKQRK